MKTILLFFALLASVTASATVTVTPISTDNANKKVTFKVEWTGSPANNRVWVWVDLCPVEGVTPGTFAPAAVTAASVTGSYYTDLNGRGFYIYASPATVTATLSITAPDGFNWCAHGSDFPPNAVESGGVYTLKGTPPFIVTTASGNVQVPGYTFAGGDILELTDATGCPGVFCGKNGDPSDPTDCWLPGREPIVPIPCPSDDCEYAECTCDTQWNNAMMRYGNRIIVLVRNREVFYPEWILDESKATKSYTTSTYTKNPVANALICLGKMNAAVKDVKYVWWRTEDAYTAHCYYGF
jgi:hypothetical protein